MMLFYKFLFMSFLVVSAFEFQSLAADEPPPMHEQLKPVTKGLIDEQDRPTSLLWHSYEFLRRNVKGNTNITSFYQHLDKFMSFIVRPINTQFNNEQIIIDYNQENFLRIAISILEKMDAVDNPFLNKNLEDTSKALSARISLARIDENVRLGHGARSHFNNPNLLSENASNTLRNLTGRIFLIKVDTNGNRDLLSTSSGTLAHHNNHAGINLAGRLPPLTHENHQILNCIITCAHAFKPDEYYRDYRTETYFVPSNALNPVSGLPNNDLNNLNDLITYLTNNPNSFKITTVHIQNKRNPFPLGRFFEIDMTMAEPQYFSDNEDCVIADIVPVDVNGHLPTYTSNITVNFFPHQALPHTRFFSIGYPGCFHYDLNVFDHHQHSAIINNGGVSPVFITSSMNAPIFNNGIITCDIPASIGMSGGGLFYENNDTLNFFGCIKSIDEESGNSSGNYLINETQGG